jgi:quinol monooxygenase YgiN
MILVIGSVEIQESKLEEALTASQEHVRRSRAESGCLEHGVHSSREVPNRLVFVERWRDIESLRAHFQLPESRSFVKLLATLAATPPTVAVYSASELSFGGKGGAQGGPPG